MRYKRTKCRHTQNISCRQPPKGKMTRSTCKINTKVTKKTSKRDTKRFKTDKT